MAPPFLKVRSKVEEFLRLILPLIEESASYAVIVILLTRSAKLVSVEPALISPFMLNLPAVRLSS